MRDVSCRLRTLDVNYEPEAYGFESVNPLVERLGSQIALTNADSYAVLGVALHFDAFDWRDGDCHSKAYWETRRRYGTPPGKA